MKRTICTATIKAVTDGEDTTIYQVEIDDQTLIKANNFQQTGMTSKAKAGGNAIVVMPNGGHRIGFVIATEDTEYEIALEEGEVAIHTSEANYIKMKADGTIEIHTTTVKIVSDDIQLNGTTKKLVTHAELDSALQAQNVQLATHTHIITAPTLPSGPPVPLPVINITASATQSITTN